jgi:hypothetical protein
MRFQSFDQKLTIKWQLPRMFHFTFTLRQILLRQTSPKKLPSSNHPHSLTTFNHLKTSYIRNHIIFFLTFSIINHGYATLFRKIFYAHHDKNISPSLSFF